MNMRKAPIVFLISLAIILGFSVFSLQKELRKEENNAAFYEKRSDDLQRELVRVSRARDEKERLLNEIEQSITDLENKVQLETLERYIPKKTWEEIKPVIDRLKALQETSESFKKQAMSVRTRI